MTTTNRRRALLPIIAAALVPLLMIVLLTLHPLAPAIGSLLIISTFPFGLTYWATYAMMLVLAILHSRKLDQTWERVKLVEPVAND